MRVTVDEQAVHVRLSLWQKVLGLTPDVTVARAQLSDAEVVEYPVREAMSSGLKFGLRLPWLCYVGRTIRLDQMFVVRRGVPALSFQVNGEGPLQRVLLSTPEAAVLVERLRSPG